MDLNKPLLCLEIDTTDNISLRLDFMLPPAKTGRADVTPYDLIVPSSTLTGVYDVKTCIFLKPSGIWPLKVRE